MIDSAEFFDPLSRIDSWNHVQDMVYVEEMGMLYIGHIERISHLQS